MTEQTFTRGGYPLRSDPSMGRTFHAGDESPRCKVCGMGIFGDEEYLPNRCPLAEEPMGPHVYPNGEKCPDVMYVATEVPDGHYLFRATDLMHTRGFDCDDTAVPEEIIAVTGEGAVDAEAWALNVVDTVVVNMLLPLLPFTYELREDNGRGNPVRLATIDGRDVNTIGEYEKHALLSPHSVSLPVTSLAALALNYTALTEAGIDEPTVLAASLAGLSVEETIAAHRDGTLHKDTLHFMTALRS